MNRIQGILGLTAAWLCTASSIYAQVKPGAAPGGMFGQMGGILPMMLIMFAIIYFLMIRPEQKKQKDRLNMLKNVKKGDKVLTIAGIYGTVSNIKENTIMVKISDTTVVEFTKSAVSSVVTGEGNVEKTAEKDDKEKKK